MKKIVYMILCAVLVLGISACTSAPSNGDTEGTTAAVNDEPITRQMRATLLQMCNVERPHGYEAYVSEEYLASFKALRKEILSSVSDMTVSEYEAYCAALTDLNATLGYKQGTLPRVYLATENGAPIVGDDYFDVSIVIVDAEGGEESAIVVNEALAKTRGNSSNEDYIDKKSYKLKFGEQQTVLSLGTSKTWNLISNVHDRTLLRNKLAYDLARELGVNVPDCTYVDVYLNGEYRGNYLLTESVSEGKTKVDISLKNGDFLMELEQNPRVNAKWDTEHAFVNTALYRAQFVIKEPEAADMEKGQAREIRDFLNAAENALSTGDIAQISAYFDVESFINYYIVAELFKNLDIAYSSTYFYAKDGIIYAGPIWDFDLSSGNVSDTSRNAKYVSYHKNGGTGTGTGNSYEGLWVAHMHHDINAQPTHYARYEHDIEEDEIEWYSAMFEVAEIRARMYARYSEAQAKIVNLYEDNALGKNRIDTLLDMISDSAYRNYHDTDTTNDSWRVDVLCGNYGLTPKATYEENVEVLRTWLKNRNEWLLWKFKDLG